MASGKATKEAKRRSGRMIVLYGARNSYDYLLTGVLTIIFRGRFLDWRERGGDVILW